MSDMEVELEAAALVAQMTLEEKTGMLSGSAFWFTKAVARLGLERAMLCDGPHGLRKQEAEADHMGTGGSRPSTCFPAGGTIAASWDPALAHAMGSALGRECAAEGVAVVLGPAINMKRHPLCGRNFEYSSEDPLLAGELAAGSRRRHERQALCGQQPRVPADACRYAGGRAHAPRDLPASLRVRRDARAAVDHHGRVQSAQRALLHGTPVAAAKGECRITMSASVVASVAFVSAMATDGP